MKNEYIKITEWPTEHAKKAYKNNNYIEAFKVLHGWIENKLQELIILTGSSAFKTDIDKSWDITNTISLMNSAKILYIFSQLSKAEYGRTVQFNRMRNELIHKILHEPYDKEYKGIPKQEFDNVFNEGLLLAEIIQEKIEKYTT